MEHSKLNFPIKLFLSAFVCVGGGWLFGLVTRQGIDNWYNHLIHPPGTPPNFVFPIVWTILYFLMAISFALVWSSPASNKKVPMLLFALQLALNFSWSWLFFVRQSPGTALIDLSLLWICIVGTIISFRKYSSVSAILMLPYLAWVSYAMYLNLFIWMNNP